MIVARWDCRRANWVGERRSGGGLMRLFVKVAATELDGGQGNLRAEGHCYRRPMLVNCRGACQWLALLNA